MPLRRCGDGLPEAFSDNVNTFCLAASGKEAVIAAPDGSVCLSADNGATWEQAAAGLPGAYCAAYA